MSKAKKENKQKYVKEELKSEKTDAMVIIQEIPWFLAIWTNFL